ncbi:hypothetical protein C4561_03560 [candidate division WWE3 bacterium]|jgi:hypothetical protein|uniref:Peptidase C39-like domain-containing protein n=1 Tax=candidate division WWE3 bacterium TaxID=2053526 RepID=A0A3A4ZJI8_UNCKA|nr:MAG: hypothetical protein C4561_03560 [candidate division WWE3 bacterium]
MIEGNPIEEMADPQATLMLEHINAKLPDEEDEKGIISERGRLNKEGRTLVDDVYSEFFKRTNGNYREVLNICKEAESLLHVEDTDSRDTEMLKVLRSVRGKIVYHAHKTWAEKEMFLDKFGDESASNIMSYAKILKKDKSIDIDIYEEATRIEKEKHQLDEALSIENLGLEQQNLKLIEEDIKTIATETPENERQSILEGLKSKLKAFSERIMEPHTRRKIVAGALAAASITSFVLGYISHNKNDIKTGTQTLAKAENQPKNTHVYYDSSELPDDLYAEEYLTGPEEIPEVDLNFQVIEQQTKSPPLEIYQEKNESIQINEVSQENYPPVYVAQTFDGQCGPASIAMLYSTFGREKFNVKTKMQDITSEFIEKKYINPDKADIISTDSQIIEFLSNEGFQATTSYEFLSFENISKYFEDPKNKPVIINVNSNYLNENTDHWALLMGVTEIDGRKYIRLMDPLRSEKGLGAEEDIDVRMIGMPDGSFLFDARGWPGVTNGLGIFIENQSVASKDSKLMH